MFLRNEQVLDEGAGAGTLSFAAPPVAQPDADGRIAALRRQFAALDLAPDLGTRIGTIDWFRGVLTCTALCSAAVALAPEWGGAIAGEVPAALSGNEWDEARAQSIAPLGWGGDSGRRMAANDLVVPLADTPERPSIDLSATLGQGDGFARVLQRSGVDRDEAARVAEMVARAVALGEIAPGTRLDMTLGRRPDKNVARPLDALAFRAKFDLKLSLARTDGALVLTRHPIAIDHTPLRIQGRVGASLYRSARAAGAPAKTVEAYLRALGGHVSVGRDVNANDQFDIIAEQARAATGEVEIGQLVFAGLDQGRKKTRLLRWEQGNRSQWFEASGVGERRGVLGAPVAGRVSSGFGMRRHPIFRFARMHKGMDFAAPYGTPIRATSDGVVAFAGRNGGYGNFVRITHGGGMGSGYGHMSRIAARAGVRVTRGQVIGYVGSTGFSTGPHLHYELYRNGMAINPRSVSFTTTAQLAGRELAAFRSKLANLMAVRSGAAARGREMAPIEIASR